jgi:glutamyl-tRNA reductase
MAPLPSFERRKVMKVGIVGVGSVGRACALALVGRGCAREIVLVDRTRTRAEAVATDIRYGLPLLPRAEITAGDYDSLAGCERRRRAARSSTKWILLGQNLCPRIGSPAR